MLESIALKAKNAAHEFKTLSACPYNVKKSLAYYTWARSWYNQLLASLLFAEEFDIESLKEQSTTALAQSFPESIDKQHFLAELIVLSDYIENDALPNF
jgi:hypothetical protein